MESPSFPPHDRRGNEFDWPCMRGGREGEGEEGSWVFPALLVTPISLLRYMRMVESVLAKESFENLEK